MVFSLLIFKFIFLLVPVLLSVAYITLLERKVLSLIGVRVGPNKVSLFGILQPIADAVKLSNKQVNLLSNFSFFFYYLSSFFMLFSTFFLWFCIFTEPSIISFKFSVIIFMIVLGFNSLNSILSGWSTFPKYPLIGSLRIVAQLISYESVLYLCIFFLLLFMCTFSFFSMQFLPIMFLSASLPYLFYIWVPSFLADLNRTPYDFGEGESELVSGFNTDFGSSSFTLIFLSEYSNIIFFCLFSSFIFFFGSLSYFFFLLFFFVIWVRAVMPRYRFDKLMILAWKFFIPFMTVVFLFFLLFLF